jgi:hypothetical protein
VNPADRDHRYGHGTLHGCRGGDVEGVGIVGAVHHPRHQPIDDAAADVKSVDAGFDERGREPGRVGAVAATGDALVARDAQGERKVMADFRFDGLDDLDDRSDPALAPVRRVGVASGVAPRRQEGSEQHIAVGGVQLDTVVAGRPDAGGGGAKEVDDGGQLLGGERPRRRAGEVRLDCRRTERLDVMEFGAETVGAGVRELRLNAGAVGVDRVGEAAMGGDDRVAGEVQ